MGKELLRECGLKATEARLYILELLQKEREPKSPSDILEICKNEYHQCCVLSPSTNSSRK